MLEGCTPFPPKTAARYRERRYWQGRTLGGIVRDWAAAYGSREALVDGDRRCSFAELDALGDGVARDLRAAGLRPLERIVVQMPNRFEFVPLLVGCFRARVLPVLALPQHRFAELSHFASHAQAAALVVAADDPKTDYVELARRVVDETGIRIMLTVGNVAVERALPLKLTPADAEPDAADPSDVAFFLLSGGTTGFSKLIPRTHDDYAYNMRRSAEVAGFGEDTRFLIALPVAHNFPLGSPGVFGALQHGGTGIFAADPSAQTCFPLIAREGVTHAAVVPTVAQRWLEESAEARASLATLRVLQVGGARLSETVAERVRPGLGCALQQVFGMAEGLLNLTRLDDPESLVFGSQGVPMSADDEVRLVDEDGADVADGEPGELLVRGPYTLRGYYRADAHNARSFTPDGYYRSGDVVRRLSSGHLVVDGRLKDVINRGGEKISAEDVENHLLAHEHVLEAAVVAMPDRLFGERSCAYVVLRAGAALGVAEIGAFFEARGLSKQMTPERVEITSRLPLTNIGKIDKRALRADIVTKLEGSVRTEVVP